MTGSADEGGAAHPFGEIARATLAAQERGLELARAWSDSLKELLVDQAEGGRAALEALASTLAAFGSLVQGWNAAFLRLLEATPEARPPRQEPT
jgi:hypothetical protein